MTFARRLRFVFFLCLASLISKAQTDTAFWFGAPAITAAHANKPIVIRFSAYAAAANVTVSMPANPSFQPISFSLNAYAAYTLDLSSYISIIESKPENTILQNGIKVSATNNISAYYEVEGIGPYGYQNPEIFTFKGSTGKGMNFMIPGQNTFDNAPGSNYANFNPKAHNGFVIIATENNTVINITPSKDAVSHPAGQSFSITLQQGETYTVIATSATGSQHLVGSVVKANKAICITVYDDSIGMPNSSIDLVGDQIIPEDANGNEFILVRGELRVSNILQDYFYILGTIDGTDIFIDGVFARKINRGEIYASSFSSPSTYIKTSNPVYLNQLTGIGGEMGFTDLPSIRCTGSPLVSFVRSVNTDFYLNLLCKAIDADHFLLKGKSGIITGNMFSAVPGTNGEWMYAHISQTSITSQIIAGAPTQVSNTSGNFHLGFLNGGPSSGSVLGYFSNYAKTTLSPKIVGLQCIGNTLTLSSNQVLGATYQWTGPNNFSDTNASTSIKNITLAHSGTYTIAANILGCGTFKDSLVLNVHSLPTATITANDSICLGKSKTLSLVLTGDAPWNFSVSDGSKIDTIKQVATMPYTWTVSPLIKTTYSLLHITDGNSCTINSALGLNVSSTVNLYPQPTVGFTTSAPLCESREVLFTDQSVANAGNIIRWNWNFKDGIIKDTASGSPFKKIFSAWGNYAVKLMVETDKGCKSDTTIINTKINPLPHVGFVLPEVCVTDGAASFTDTTSIADASQSQFAWSWKIFPGTNNNKQPVFVDATAQNAKVLVTKEDYYKTLLKVTSKDGCADSLFQQLTVNGPTPKASFVVQNAGGLCSNDSVRIMNTSTVDFGNVTRLDIIWDALNAPAVKMADENPRDSILYAKKYTNFASPATQSYTVKLVAFSGNASGCQNTATQIVTINRSPQINFVKPRDICHDASARIILPQASWYSGFPAASSVYSGTGISNGVTGLFDPSIAGAGTFNIKFLQVSDMGCKDSVTQPITVWPSPIAKWGISSPACEKNQIIFTDSSLAGYSNIIQRVWDFGDGATISRNNADSFSHVYSGAKIYQASLKVVTDSGCVSVNNILSLNIHYLPKVDFSLPAICLPDGRGQFNSLTSIGDSSSSLFSYRWNFNDPIDPTSSALPNPIHRYSALGPYPVQLIVRSNNNCVDSSTKILNTVYPQPKADFSIAPPEICVNSSIQFTDLSNGKTSAVNRWSWDLANNSSSSLQNPSKNFADTGTFQIKLYITNTQGCVSDTAVKQVVIHPYPVLVMGNSKMVLEGGSVSLTAQYIYGTQLNYLWTPSQFLSSDTARAPIASPIDDISYRLLLTGIGGCSVTDTLFVKVLKSPLIPNAFSPNGDGIHDEWRIQYLESYPGATVEVFNRYGQKVFGSVGYDKPWDGKYNGKPLPVGTYYYIINPKNGRQIISGSITIIL
ncbi:MAG: gliding motility-associated C-terminal domain-containing protein [Chitinophagaceae bacterium]|nr:gliding motility-associated C-terminal domain-containing protein [Chitinophagaceae bacterium]